jgi:hypothetical protein
VKEPVKFRIVTNGKYYRIERWKRVFPWFGKWAWRLTTQGQSCDRDGEYPSLAAAELDLRQINWILNPSPWHPVPHNEPAIRAIEEANQDDAA